MNKTTTHLLLLFLFFPLMSIAGEKETNAPWSNSLYLGNSGFWHRRIKIDVRNNMIRAAAGIPVVIKIGDNTGEVRLAGVQAESIRVCGKDGRELLFRIEDPDGILITSGRIPPLSSITLPVECQSKKTTSLYIYFDNPKAWPVPDFLMSRAGVRNCGVEKGTGDAPFAWQHDQSDQSHKSMWTTEGPHSGKYCLKTIVAPGASVSWISTRQQDIYIEGGAEYIIKAWVKTKGVHGNAGWYIHVGNNKNRMLISPMLFGGGGTYDWKEVTATFKAPADATRADLGTVLRGTGTAWFDDITLNCKSSPKLIAHANPPENLKLKEINYNSAWLKTTPKDIYRWNYRVPVRIINSSVEEPLKSLFSVDISPVLSRLHADFETTAICITDGKDIIPHCVLKGKLLFESVVPTLSIRTYYVYLSKSFNKIMVHNLTALFENNPNLVKNPSFERGDKLPDSWTNSGTPDVTYALVKGGVVGEKCAMIHVGKKIKKNWTGWHQNVPVLPGKTYLFGGWIKCEKITDGTVSLNAHYKDASGKLCKVKQFASTGSQLSGTTGWTLLSGLFKMPEDAGFFELHLTMFARGTLFHDGIFLVRAANGFLGRLESVNQENLSTPVAWQVNSIVKVFHEDLPPPSSSVKTPKISLALNEKEPLQLALRSPRDLHNLKCIVDLPENKNSQKLSHVSVGVIGYVPIDHKTSYYRDKSRPWYRRIPTSEGKSDGWAGMWPDPLLPRSSFDLNANQTQPIWITVSTTRNASPGNYKGLVRFLSGRKTILSVPFKVHVWNFTLPEKNHVGAIYDLRLGKYWQEKGKTSEQLYRNFWKFMSDHRVCPNRIQPDPVIRYRNGKVYADFKKFDAAAEIYFNKLGMSYTYTPWFFYLFGWGNPPHKFFGEEPYEGGYPYDGVDRTKLRPSYKTAYQECLRAYWNHMKEKGWQKKCVLYISDEPHFYSHHYIIDQMKALCNMIHEAVPEIPIYSSTWEYVPEWKNSIDIWGISHYGKVSTDRIAEIHRSGKRLWFTTDGQMCTDTPYCAVERLLPHYCFKYNIDAYEFWGISWLTYNPYKVGWHRYIHQSSEPGNSFWVRYPNGDGYLAYPGSLIGHSGPVSSIRLEQAREGVEDYEYLYLLRSLVRKAKKYGSDARAGQKALNDVAELVETGQKDLNDVAELVETGQKALNDVAELVEIPNAGGRYSTRILKDPDVIFITRKKVAEAIEQLLKVGE